MSVPPPSSATGGGSSNAVWITLGAVREEGFVDPPPLPVGLAATAVLTVPDVPSVGCESGDLVVISPVGGIQSRFLTDIEICDLTGQDEYPLSITSVSWGGD